MKKPAVFLDRDNTLVVDPGFIDHPDKLRLVPGACEAVRLVNESGYRVVVASNQSGVARGLFDEQKLAEIHHRLERMLADGGARLDGIYYCPYLEGAEAVVAAYRRKSELRKPAPGMLIRAANDMDLDLSRSWMIGDSARDILAGAAAGCRTVLVARNGATLDDARIRPDARAETLLEAVKVVLSQTDGTVNADDQYDDDQRGLDSGVRRNDACHDGASRADRTLNADGQCDDDQRDDDQLGLDSGVRRTDGLADSTFKILVEIRDLLDKQARQVRQDDFSVVRLLATLLQMVTIFVAGWGVLGMLDGDVGGAQSKLTLAVVLQLAMITLILADRRR